MLQPGLLEIATSVHVHNIYVSLGLLLCTIQVLLPLLPNDFVSFLQVCKGDFMRRGCKHKIMSVLAAVH